MEMVNFDKADLMVENLNDIVKEYDFKNNKNLLLDLDFSGLDESTVSVDLVVYDTEGLSEKELTVKEFHDIITENGTDEEPYEIDRWTLVKGI